MKEVCENTTVCLKSPGDKKGKTTLASKHCYAAEDEDLQGNSVVKEEEDGGGGRGSNQVVTRTSPPPCGLQHVGLLLIY